MASQESAERAGEGFGAAARTEGVPLQHEYLPKCEPMRQHVRVLLRGGEHWQRRPRDPETSRRAEHAPQRVKELAVRKVLEEAFPDCMIIFDRAVKDDDDPNSYKTRWAVAQRTLPNLDRPDVRFVGGARVILVEVDENSHVTYVCREEREREARIVGRALTGRKGAPEAVLLRFNPDAYTDCAGRRGRAAAGRSKGCMTTTVTNEREWKRRTNDLVETIKTLQIPEGEPGHFALPLRS